MSLALAASLFLTGLPLLATGQTVPAPGELTNVGGGINWTNWADIDGDGDQDLLLATDKATTVVWLENHGSGQLDTLNQAKPISSGFGLWALTAYCVDLDGDGVLEGGGVHLGGLPDNQWGLLDEGARLRSVRTRGQALLDNGWHRWRPKDGLH